MIVSFVRQSWGWLLAAILGVFLIVAWLRFDAIARVGAGYKAKIACSEIFLAGRDADDVANGEFNDISPLMPIVGLRVAPEDSTIVAAAPLRIGRSAAIYREGYGCTLANGGKPTPLPALAPAGANAPLTKTPDAAKSAALDEILDEAFSDGDAGHRAIVVLKNGELVAERYADGFDETTPLLSWSMAKSITATLIGAASHQGLLDIDDPAPVPEWKDGDPRTAITWRDLLQMQSGLAFEEDYGSPRSDVNVMLFASDDTGAAGAAQPASYKPGEHWAYSSGTSNLLSRTLKMQLEQHGADYHAFGRAHIFDPIGAASVVMEPDASGVFIGSSFIYATARDWAKLGQLYLQDGVWNGDRLLPEGWTEFVAEPAGASDRQYGGHFWLNRDGENGRSRFIPGLPEDTYFMSGHEGQYVFIIPSADLVIVRLGLTRGKSASAVTGPVVARLYDAALDPS